MIKYVKSEEYKEIVRTVDFVEGTSARNYKIN